MKPKNDSTDAIKTNSKCVKTNEKSTKDLKLERNKDKDYSLPDLSILKKPVETSVCGAQDIVKLFETGTSEVKDILVSECFILFECKICRNLFRSVANFITHKRSYCKDKFKIWSGVVNGHEAIEHASIVGPNKGSSTALRKTCRKDIISLLEGYIERKESVNSLIKSHTFTAIKESSVGVYNNTLSEAVVEQGLTLQGKSDLPASLQRRGGGSLNVNDVTSRNSDNGTTSSETIYACPNCDKESASLKWIRKHIRQSHCTSEEDYKKMCLDIRHKVMPCVTSDRLSFGKIDESSPSSHISNLPNGVVGVIGPDGKIAGARLSETCIRCLACSEEFDSEQPFTFHLQDSCNPLKTFYICPLCNKGLSTRYAVSRHLKSCHQKTETQLKRLKDKIVTKLLPVKSQIQLAAPSPKPDATPPIFQEKNKCYNCGEEFDRRVRYMSHVQNCNASPASDSGAKGKRRSSSIERIVSSDEKRGRIEVRMFYDKSSCGDSLSSDKHIQLAPCKVIATPLPLHSAYSSFPSDNTEPEENTLTSGPASESSSSTVSPTPEPLLPYEHSLLPNGFCIDDSDDISNPSISNKESFKCLQKPSDIDLKEEEPFMFPCQDKTNETFENTKSETYSMAESSLGDSEKPLLSQESEQPLISNDSEPPLSNDLDEPLLSHNSGQPLLPQDSKPPPLSSDLEQPLLSNESEIAVSNDSEHPLLSHDSEPPLLSHDSEQPLLSHDSEPPLLSHDSEPPLLSHDSEPPLLSHDSDPSLLNDLEQPFLPLESGQPLLSHDSEQTSVSHVSKVSSSLHEVGEEPPAFNDSDSPEEETDTFSPLLLYIYQPKKVCLICGRTFPSLRLAIQDVASHLGVYRYKCKINLCEFKSYTKFEIQRHIYLTHKAKRSQYFYKDLSSEDMLIDVAETDFLGFDVEENGIFSSGIHKKLFPYVDETNSDDD